MDKLHYDSAAVAEKIAALFAEATGACDVGLDDSFTRLGGRGKQAIALFGRIRKELGVDLPPRALFSNPTPRQLAAFIATLPGAILHKGDVFDVRLVRRARDPARCHGAILCMPQLGGSDDYVAILAAATLHEFDIWSTRFRLDHPDDTTQDDWVDRPYQLYRWLMSHPTIAWRGFLGFCAGGPVAWLIERLMVEAGRDPLPVVILDAIPEASFDQNARAALARRLTLPPYDTPSRVLLLHRPSYGQMRAPCTAAEI